MGWGWEKSVNKEKYINYAKHEHINSENLLLASSYFKIKQFLNSYRIKKEWYETLICRKPK